MVSEAPFGVLVVVHRQVASQREYLLLHRAHYGPDYAGAWAWGPPGGSREPSETADECARRELLEETGLALPVRRVLHPVPDWAVYVAEARDDEGITLSEEHDRHLWVSAQNALAATSPGIIVAELESAVRMLEKEP